MVGTQAGDGDAIRDAFDSEDSGIRIQAVSTGTGTCTAVQPRTAYTVPVYTLPVLCTGSRSMINTQLPVFYMCSPAAPRLQLLAASSSGDTLGVASTSGVRVRVWRCFRLF